MHKARVLVTPEQLELFHPPEKIHANHLERKAMIYGRPKGLEKSNPWKVNA